MLCVFLGNVVFLLCGGCMRLRGWAWVCVCVCLVRCVCVWGVRVCGCVYRAGVYVGHVCLCVCWFFVFQYQLEKDILRCLGIFFACCESIKSR